MKKPKDYPKALLTLQLAEITLYVTAAVVIYRFAGDGVTSPALGYTSPILKKVAWGVAIPTVCSVTISVCLRVLLLTGVKQIVISGVINGHVAVVSRPPGALRY
jgi:hypothetical protein